ncbi:hypothetical protein AX17_000505 [Amanita inopinata Kibby_2008]|nr:hypothetical protein AX17_000505 [Amanita inopinata Kibby_2008]
MLAFRGAAVARSLATGTRRYASTTASTPNKSSNLPIFLLAAGAAGMGGYWYLDYNSKNTPVGQEKSPFDPENFVDFRLKRIEPYNHNTSKFVFELPDNKASLLPVASCLVVRPSDPEVLKDAKGKPIIRPYTPISPPEQRGELTLLIKNYEKGNTSKYIHTLKEGDTLAMKGPIPKFPYKANEVDEVALIGGGTGITPLYQVLHYALSDKSNKTKFKLLFSNITEKDILIRQELDELKQKHPNNFDIVYLVDQPGSNWTGKFVRLHLGRCNQATRCTALSGRESQSLRPPGQVAALAGKKAGMKQGELGGVLKELGYTEEQVYKF